MCHLYRFIEHTPSGTQYAFVRASSKKEVAKVLGVPVSRLQGFCDRATGTDILTYSHLMQGEVIRVCPQAPEKPDGISVLALERIASIGYLNSASQSLSQCDIPNRELRNRLHKIREDLQALTGDLREELVQQYGGRKA